MDLTAAQDAVVRQGAGVLVAVGGPGTGKTTALRHRYLRLAAEAGAGRVLVLARSRRTAARFREAVLPSLQGGFDSLPVTTAWGLALDAVTRADGPVRLLSGAEQRSLVSRLLADEARATGRWPTLDGYVGRPAFAREVADVLVELRAELAGPEEVQARAEAAGAGDRWRELLAFAVRYEDELDRRGVTDAGRLLARAACLPIDDRFPHVLVDDHDTAGRAAAALIGGLVAAADTAVVAGNPAADLDGRLDALGGAQVMLTEPFRHPTQGGLVRSRHPSTEPEALAGEVLAAAGRGVPWDDIAVLVRSAAGRGRAVARSLARHGAPVAPPPGTASGEPAVHGLLALLAWVQGDDAAIDAVLASPVSDLDAADVRSVRRRARERGEPLEAQPELARLVDVRARLLALGPVAPTVLALEAFRLGLPHLVSRPDAPAAEADDRALDAIVAWLDATDRHGDDVDAPPDPWVDTAPRPRLVTVTSIASAAGCEWPTVLVGGCVEGELPRIRTGRRFFDRPLLQAGPVPTVPERRRRSLEEERRLFATAWSRATDVVTASAAPEPGVLVSRFVDTLPDRREIVPPVTDRPPPPLAPTDGPAPVWPQGALRLSASQLETFADCPLRYGYRYAIGARDEPGLPADLGTIVHDVLERFLDPAVGEPRTLDRLWEIAEECWREDIAPYRPMQEEARRDYFDMLSKWWEKEGSLGDMAPTVLATERQFTIEVGPHTVTGRIDRVDRADDGVGIRVVDYKTGKRVAPVNAMADDLQLATYHLAATRDPELAAFGPPTELRLLYVRTMTVREQEVTPDHAAVTEARILAAAERILAADFEPSVHADCDHCEFHRLCPLWPEGREVGAQP